MKKLTLILMALLVATTFISCNEAENLPENEIQNEISGDVSGGESPEIPEEKEENIAPEDSTPKILYTAEENVEIDYTIDGTGFAVFRVPTGEWTAKYGIIDMDGNVVIEPTYDLMGWCDWHNVIYAEPFLEGDSPIYIDDTHKIDLHYGHGGDGAVEYIYSEKDGKYYTYSSMYGDVSINEFTGEEIPQFTPYVITKAGLTTGYFSIGEYAPITDYMMEEYHTYAFIGERGAEILMGELSSAAGSFVNGYMPVSRDGKWAYFNTLGEAVTDFEYDGATNAHENKAWVKKDGTWCVINLK